MRHGWETPEKSFYFLLQILGIKNIELCCTDSCISHNICGLLDFVFEIGFIHQFVAFVPKIVIWCDIKVIQYKMKMGYTLPK